MALAVSVGVGLLVVLLVVAVVRQLLKLALFLFVATLLVVTLYWLLAGHSPATVSGAVHSADPVDRSGSIAQDAALG